MSDEEKKSIEKLNELLNYCKKEKLANYENIIRTVLNYITKLQKENEELISDNLEYQRIQDVFDKRTYRKKYLEERRKETPNLLYPDADEIYKRYYELKEENKKKSIEIICYQEELGNSIPKQVIKDKIEELSDNKDFDEDVYVEEYAVDVLKEILGE